MLYRREIRCTDLGKAYNPPDPPRPNSVLIKDAGPAENLNHLLYVDFPTTGKLAAPKASALATAAIDSARRRQDGRDGITYLHSALVTESVRRCQMRMRLRSVASWACRR